MLDSCLGKISGILSIITTRISSRDKSNPPIRLANSKAGIKPTAPLSAFDKENLIEFPLDSLYYLYNYYMVCALLSHTYHVTYHVIPCDIMLWLPVMWLWLCNTCDTFPHFLLCSKSKIKEKKKKRNINNNLAVLPSHDTPRSNH